MAMADERMVNVFMSRENIEHVIECFETWLDSYPDAGCQMQLFAMDSNFNFPRGLLVLPLALKDED